MPNPQQPMAIILSAANNFRIWLLQPPAHFQTSQKVHHLDRSGAHWRDPRIFFRSVTSFRSLSRLFQVAALASITILMLGAGDPSTNRFSRIGHHMICPCGCTQVLLECNHVGCTDSDRMIGELRAQMTTGGNDTSILNWFAAKYGPTVLAAPIRGGFDNVAWIAPIAVFLLATIGTAFIIRIWKLRTGSMVGTPHPASGAWVASPAATALRERIRRETEY